MQSRTLDKIHADAEKARKEPDEEQRSSRGQGGDQSRTPAPRSRRSGKDYRGLAKESTRLTHKPHADPTDQARRT